MLEPNSICHMLKPSMWPTRREPEESERGARRSKAQGGARRSRRKAAGGEKDGRREVRLL